MTSLAQVRVVLVARLPFASVHSHGRHVEPVVHLTDVVVHVSDDLQHSNDRHFTFFYTGRKLQYKSCIPVSCLARNSFLLMFSLHLLMVFIPFLSLLYNCNVFIYSLYFNCITQFIT